jgi:hypothetical protein
MLEGDWDGAIFQLEAGLCVLPNDEQLADVLAKASENAKAVARGEVAPMAAEMAAAAAEADRVKAAVEAAAEEARVKAEQEAAAAAAHVQAEQEAMTVAEAARRDAEEQVTAAAEAEVVKVAAEQQAAATAQMVAVVAAAVAHMAPALAPGPAPAGALAVAWKCATCQCQMSLEAWLSSINLDRYHGALVEEGYDELQFLKDADEDDITEIIETIGMKKPHIKTFLKNLALLTSGS